MKNIISIPIVFFLYFLIFFFLVAFIGGLSLYYSFATTETIDTTLLFLCSMKMAYFMSPIVIIVAAVGIYVMLLRYSMHFFLQILIFIACILLSITYIIPQCYSYLQFIDEAIAAHQLKPISNKFLIRFIDKPLFLINLMHNIYFFLNDLYTVYTKSFTFYIIFLTAFFILICSFFIISAISTWNMINITILMILLRIFFLVYPYSKYTSYLPFFDYVNSNSSFRHITASVLYMSIFACIFYLLGGIRMYYFHKLKKQKRKK